VLAALGAVQQRVAAAQRAEDDAALEACVADLRALLEWTTYQSQSVATARAATATRRARTYAERLGLLGERDAILGNLGDAESSLIASVREKSGYMRALAARNRHLELPAPLISADALVEQPAKPPGRLALVQALRQTAKRRR
jgi:hypothetical protein